jgi:hypothetical protein
MAIVQGQVNQHWNYFLAFDADLSRLSRYIEFHTDNYNCFSLEIARVLLAAASEVDVVAKLLCRKVKPDSKAENINDYQQEILNAFPKFGQFEVLAERFGLSMHPWDEWANGRSPFWWRAYNEVKHQRDAHFQKANLKNMLNAVAGLFVACLYLYEEEAQATALHPTPEVLSAGRQHLRGVRAVGIDRYKLD